ncbi:MAG TPA: tol-pal system-associated acyl-CoA thioesterase [Burkholderiales bacterium]|nr:tol-pal system-associated acyl-CoA thioesterase [Burkholderiales bacterium]
MKKSEPAHAPDFIWPVRVYYEDTDAAGVVFYANYLKFMERARTEWLRSLGFEQTTLMHEHNVVFVVRSLAVEYLRPAVFNDALEITVTLTGTRGSLLEISQAVRRGQRVLVSGDVRVACVNTQSFKPVRIPAAILDKLATRKA